MLLWMNSLISRQVKIMEQKSMMKNSQATISGIINQIICIVFSMGFLDFLCLYITTKPKP